MGDGETEPKKESVNALAQAILETNFLPFMIENLSRYAIFYIALFDLYTILLQQYLYIVLSLNQGKMLDILLSFYFVIIMIK